MRVSLFFKVVLLSLAIVGTTLSHSEAMMGGGTGMGFGQSNVNVGVTNSTGSTVGMMNGANNLAISSGAMMTKQVFNMTSGMTNTPVVASNGTAYVVSFSGATKSGNAVPFTYSYASKLNAITTAGDITSITLEGIVSTPVISGSTLALSASLSGYMMDVNNSTSGSPLTLYILTLPITSSSTPVSVSLDGDFASEPVISGNYIYVTTTDIGLKTATTSYLYIISLTGAQVAKVELQ